MSGPQRVRAQGPVRLEAHPPMGSRGPGTQKTPMTACHLAGQPPWRASSPRDEGKNGCFSTNIYAQKHPFLAPDDGGARGALPGALPALPDVGAGGPTWMRASTLSCTMAGGLFLGEMTLTRTLSTKSRLATSTWKRWPQFFTHVSSTWRGQADRSPGPGAAGPHHHPPPRPGRLHTRLVPGRRGPLADRSPCPHVKQPVGD